MIRLYFTSLLLFSAASAGMARADDNNVTYGTLACVAQLERIDPSQPPDLKDAKLQVLARSSAFFIGGSGGNVFLVTAAHNLVDCSDVKVSHDRFGSPTAPISIVDASSKSYFEKYIYFDQAEDLAVFQLVPRQAKRLNDGISRKQNNKTVRTPGKLVGSIWEPKDTEGSPNILPRGGVASSAGTVNDGFEAKPPAYSCTISRYLKGNEFKIPLRSIYFDDFNKNPQSFRAKVVHRARSLQFLIVESMSIRAGFSGSPIIISKDHFFDDGDIVGVVLGGSDASAAGRMAWAAPSESIKGAINALTTANKGEIKPGWEKKFSDKNGEVLEDSNNSGRWLTSFDLATLAGPYIKEEFQSPYSHRYSIESRVEFKGSSKDPALCQHKLRRRIENLPGRAFRFERITFTHACLDEVNLLSPYFKDCVFKATRFHASVLTGAVFDSCQYIDAAGNVRDIQTLLKEPSCPACSPAAIIAPQVKGRYVEPENEAEDSAIRLADK